MGSHWPGRDTRRPWGGECAGSAVLGRQKQDLGDPASALAAVAVFGTDTDKTSVLVHPQTLRPSETPASVTCLHPFLLSKRSNTGLRRIPDVPGHRGNAGWQGRHTPPLSAYRLGAGSDGPSPTSHWTSQCRGSAGGSDREPPAGSLWAQWKHEPQGPTNPSPGPSPAACQLRVK